MSKKIRNNFRKQAYNIFLFVGAKQDGSLLYQTQIARELIIPITTLNYHITKWRQEGLMNDRLELTPKGKRLWEKLWENETLSMKIRAHNIQVKFEVIKCPVNFPDCFDKIYTPLSNGKYSGVKTKFDDVSVMFYNRKKIVCTLPDVYGDTEEDCMSGIQKLCTEIKQRLEVEFKGIVINGYELAQITTLHVARMNSLIIEQLASRRGNFKIGDVEIDSSKGKGEIEAVNPKNAFDTIGKINSLLESPQLNNENDKKNDKVVTEKEQISDKKETETNP